MHCMVLPMPVTACWLASGLQDVLEVLGSSNVAAIHYSTTLGRPSNFSVLTATEITVIHINLKPPDTAKFYTDDILEWIPAS